MRTLILHVQVQASFLDTHIGITFNYHIFLCISQPKFFTVTPKYRPSFIHQTKLQQSFTGWKQITLPWYITTEINAFAIKHQRA